MDWVFVPTKKKEEKGKEVAPGGGEVCAFRKNNRVKVLGPDARLDWLLSLGPEDRVYTYAAGFGVSALLHGALVRRPREENPQILVCSTRLFSEGKQRTSKTLTTQEIVAEITTRADEPGVFTMFHPAEWDVLALRQAVVSFLGAQRTRIQIENRERALRQNDKTMFDPETRKDWEEDLEELGAYRISFLSMARQTEDAIAERVVNKIIKRSPYLTPLFDRLKVRGVSNGLLSRYAAKVLTIRRFPGLPGFRHFCGVYPTSKGRLVKMERGQMGGYTPSLKMATYLVSGQLVMQGNAEYRGLYDTYKERKLAEHWSGARACKICKPDVAWHVEKMARWRIGRRFLDNFWKGWWEFAEGKGFPVRAQHGYAEDAVPSAE